MTTTEAYETALEVTVTHFQDTHEHYDEDVEQEDVRDFILGEAAGWLADLDMMPDVRQAALRGLVEASSALGLPHLFNNERDLANQVAEALNTAL